MSPARPFARIHACTRNDPGALPPSVVWTCTKAFPHRNDTGDVHMVMSASKQMEGNVSFLKRADETLFVSHSDSCLQRRHLFIRRSEVETEVVRIITDRLKKSGSRTGDDEISYKERDFSL